MKIVLVDSFTQTPFTGNPAAVCLLETALDDTLMQKIAAEMNLSETAFVYPTDINIPKYSLRWFTPTNEVPLCGHATLATAYVILTKTEMANRENVILSFETLSGELTVKALPKESNNEPLYLEMNFPLGKPIRVELSEDIKVQLLQALNAPDSASIQDIQFCDNTKKLLVVFDSIDTILELNPNASKLQEISFNYNVRGVICTTKNVGNEYTKYNIVSRYFAPWNGIPEDPVTGSAHTVLGAYWNKILTDKGRQEGDVIYAYQASPKRGGELLLKIMNEERIAIRGTARIVMEGTLNI